MPSLVMFIERGCIEVYSILEGNELFTKLRKQVNVNSDQNPQYGDISKAGHDGGDFLFVRQQ